MFLGIQGKELDVVFNNSTLSVQTDPQTDLTMVQFKSLTFSRVHLDKCLDVDAACPALYQFLDVSTTEHILFSETSMNFDDLEDTEWGIDIRDAQSVKFENCDLKHLKPMSIRARSTDFRFVGSHLTSVNKEAIEIIGATNVTFVSSTIDGLHEQGITATANNINCINSLLTNTQNRAFSGFNTSSVTFQECNITDFSSNMFLGIQGKELDIVFKDSMLSAPRKHVDLENVQVKSLTFSRVRCDSCPNLDYECPAAYHFLDVSTTEHILFSETSMNFADLKDKADIGIDIRSAQSVKFEKCYLKYLRPKSIRAQSTNFSFVGSHLRSVEKGAIEIIGAKVVTFLDSTVDTLYEEGIKATANNVSLIDSLLSNTQRRALMGLVSIDDSSVLTLRNLTLDNPARGALLTNFHTGMLY